MQERYFTLENWIHGELKQAQQYLERTLERDLHHALDIASLPDPTERLARAHSARRSFESLLAISSQLQETRYDAVLRFKGLTHRVKMVGQQRLLRTPGHKNVLDNLRFTQAELARLSYHPPQSQNDHSQWSAEYVAVARRLAELYRTTKSRVSPLELPADWKQLQARLRAEEALVDYVLYRNSYSVWILKQQGEPIRYELGEAHNVEREANAFRNAALDFTSRAIWDCDSQVDSQISERSYPVSPRGMRILTSPPSKFPVCRVPFEVMAFRQRVWDMVEKELGETIKTVYIVPDAVLATVPFSALPGSKPHDFLLDEKLIIISPPHKTCLLGQKPRRLAGASC